jgi:hypothetical protein
MVQSPIITSIMGSSMERKRKDGEDGENAELLHVRLGWHVKAEPGNSTVYIKEYLYKKK